MKKTTSPKKGFITVIVILLVIFSVGFIAVRSGALKLNFKISQNTPAKNLKIPSFGFIPPSSYSKVDADTAKGEIARFESSRIDSETVSGGSVTTNAIISLKVAGSYTDLASFVQEYSASGSKAQGFQLLDSTSLSTGGQKIELKYQTNIGPAQVTIHELAYLYFKDGVSFLLKGYAADSAWDKHQSVIKASLDTFKFK